ncbi:SDR family NAD(P)-dependent oxidoreductase [Bradyrhizobium sp. USDA 4353]
MSKTKIAVITGGSRGLGRSMVLNLAKRGVPSVFTYNSSPEEARAVAREARDAGSKATALQLDVGATEEFNTFAGRLKEALRDLGADRFDYLVNNAGISNHTKFTEVTSEELDKLYAVNFKGPFMLTQKLLPLIKDGGQIVNISTGVTRFVNPDSVAYAVFKGAIEVFTRYLAHDLGSRGISVNTVAPGAIMTDFSGGVVRDNPSVNKLVAGMTALGRPGEADDIGRMIASLLSDDNHWINAQRIEVSGGMRL